jgi:1-acyl-sn-glycerol-3-phosphate acyltransferase
MSPWAVPLIKMRLRTKVVGKHHVPKKGAAIIVSNHLSALDHIVLPAITKRVIFNISKKEHFDKPFKAWVMRNWGVIPIDRGAGDTSALDKAKDILRSGELFCIYPEGTRSPDGRLYKGRTGVARIALDVGVPIIPVAMRGTFEAKPKGAKGINKGVRTAAIVGKPLDFSKYYGKHESRRVCRKVTNEVMAALQKLSGQEYVNDYAPNKVYEEAAKQKAALEAEAE